MLKQTEIANAINKNRSVVIENRDKIPIKNDVYKNELIQKKYAKRQKRNLN